MKKIYSVALFVCLSVILNAQYTKLLDFTGANGQSPGGDLFYDGTFLYGTSAVGGINDFGTIFKLRSDGTSFSTLHDFEGRPIDGSVPFCSLYFDGTFLYGMTSQDGLTINSTGTAFKIQPDGNLFELILDFTSVTGDFPRGTFISDGTFLYGMTQSGGINNNGVIFKVLPDGNGFTKLLDFDGTTTGIAPSGELISDGTFLYGMAMYGGTNNFGTIFKIMPDGSGFSKLHDFTDTINGLYPTCNLVSDGTFFYGMTAMGGANQYGTIFKIKHDGSNFTKLFDFNGSNGAFPYASLLLDGMFLYGMTGEGGANDSGTVFKIKPDGSDFTKLHDFNGPNGANPWGSLISDGSFLYGTTNLGGTNNMGVIFKVSTANITGNTLLCIGDATTLTASGGTNYLWSTGGTTNNIVVAPSTTTIYTVTATTGTFVATITTTVTVSPPPVASISGNLSICSGNCTTLTASGGGTYVWSPSTGLSCVSCINPNACPSISTTYTLVTTIGTCTDATTATITTYPNNLSASISSTPAADCSTCNGTATINTLNGISPYFYAWIPSFDSTQTVSNICGGNYFAIISDAIGCTTTASGTVNSSGVNLTMENDTLNPLVWYLYDTIYGSTAPFTYLWDFGDGNTSTLINPTHTYSVAGHYAICLTVTDANGCVSTSCDSTYKLFASGTIQILIVKHPLVIGISSPSTSEYNISTYPNPSNGIFIVDSPMPILSIEILNILGENIYSSNIYSIRSKIDIGEEKSGIYFLHIKTVNGLAVRKIIKE